MMFRRLVLYCLCFLLCVSGSSKASSTEGEPQPDRNLEFLRDHGAHPEFRYEWWYYSGHLTSTAGERFGYLLFFFRTALGEPERKGRPAGKGQSANLYVAHLALTGGGKRSFLSQEKIAPDILGLAGADVNLKVWVQDWRAESRGTEHHLQAGGKDFSLNLRMTPVKSPVVHGEEGAP